MGIECRTKVGCTGYLRREEEEMINILYWVAVGLGILVATGFAVGAFLVAHEMAKDRRKRWISWYLG